MGTGPLPLQFEFLGGHQDAVLVSIEPVPRREGGASERYRDVTQAQIPLAALERIRVERFDAKGHFANVLRVADAAVDDDALPSPTAAITTESNPQPFQSA